MKVKFIDTIPPELDEPVTGEVVENELKRGEQIKFVAFIREAMRELYLFSDRSRHGGVIRDLISRGIDNSSILGAGKIILIGDAVCTRYTSPDAQGILGRYYPEHEADQARILQEIEASVHDYLSRQK